MEANEQVAAQQFRLGALGVGCFQRLRAVLSEFVETLIVTSPRLGHI